MINLSYPRKVILSTDGFVNLLNIDYFIKRLYYLLLIIYFAGSDFETILAENISLKYLIIFKFIVKIVYIFYIYMIYYIFIKFYVNTSLS